MPGGALRSAIWILAASVSPQQERLVAGAQVACPLAVADVDPGVADRPRQHHERRQSTAAGATQVRNGGTIMWIFQVAAEQLAGLHQLMAGLMDRRGPVMDRAHDGVAVGHAAHERQMFANLDAVDVGLDGPEGATDVFRGIRFEIPGIQLARPTHQEKQNTVEVAARAGGACLHVGQRQTDGPCAEGTHPQEIAAGQTVAESNWLFAQEIQHDRILSAIPGTNPPFNMIAAAPADATQLSGCPRQQCDKWETRFLL